MPKMYIGRSGIITEVITLSVILLSSSIMFLKATEPVNAIPRPSIKASTSADITSMKGGIEMVKKGVSLFASVALLTAFVAA